MFFLNSFLYSFSSRLHRLRGLWRRQAAGQFHHIDPAQFWCFLHRLALPAADGMLPDPSPAEEPQSTFPPRIPSPTRSPRLKVCSVTNKTSYRKLLFLHFHSLYHLFMCEPHFYSSYNPYWRFFYVIYS